MNSSITVSHPTSIVKGTVEVPSSKSISNRVLIIDQLMKGKKNKITNLSTADDTLILQKAIQQIKNNESKIDVGHAGTAMRFLTALLSITEGEWILSGSERMHQRPIGQLVKALQQLGADISFAKKKNFPPLIIKGKKITGGEISIAGNVSSQFISALMMIAPVMKNGLTINILLPIYSESYIQTTLKLMMYFGIRYIRIENKYFIFHQPYKPESICIEADWSSIAFFYEIAALSKRAEIIIKNVSPESMQGDFFVAELFDKAFGVKSKFEKGNLIIIKKVKSKMSKQTDFDFSTNPDLVQAFLATQAGLKQDCVLENIEHLAFKETDRLKAMSKELKKLKGDFKKTKNKNYELKCKPFSFEKSKLKFETYDDHRMAMSLAPLCLQGGDVIINNPEVVKKSFPDYWKQLKNLGFTIA